MQQDDVLYPVGEHLPCFGGALHIVVWTTSMTYQVGVRCTISLICAVTLAVSSPPAVAQRSAVLKQVQGPTGPAAPQPLDKQRTGSESAKPPVAVKSAPSIDAREIKIDGRPLRGAKNANVTIVFFDDFQCPYAAYMYRTLFEEILKDYGDRVKIVLRETPNTEIHTWARHAAINAECLAAQNHDAYWDFADYVHAHQTEIEVNPPAVLDKLAIEQGQIHNLPVPPLQECIETQSDILFKASRSEAINQLGVRDVPTLFINGEKLLGSVVAQLLRDAIDRALRDAGQPVPATRAPDATNPAESPQRFSKSSSSSELDRFDYLIQDGTAQASAAH